MSESQSPELEEVWAALEPHVVWPRGLALILLFADHPRYVDELRGRVAAAVGPDDEQALRVIVPGSDTTLSSLVGEILTPPSEQVRAVWIELWRSGGDPKWESLLGQLLAALNTRRTALERFVRRPLVLVLPSTWRTRVYVVAPDLWTIRSFTASLPSPPSVASLSPSAPIKPSFLLPPPSLVEKEWARLFASGEFSRIDPWDGLQAVDAATERGSLSSARHIAEQVAAVILHEHIQSDSGALTVDTILHGLDELSSDTAKRALSACIERLGDTEVEIGNLSTARILFQRVLELRERLASAAPGSAQAQGDLSISLNALGNIELQAGNLSAARSLFQRSLDICEQLASAAPHNTQAQYELSFSLENLGKVELQAGNLPAARNLFQRSFDVREQLASADPHDARAQRDLSISLNRLGEIELQAGNFSTARSLFQRSLDVFEQLASAKPHSAQAQRDLSISIDRLGDIESQAGNLSAARNLFQRSLDVREQLASADPHSVDAQRNLASIHARFIELGAHLGDVELQRKHLNAGQAVLDAWGPGAADEFSQARALRKYFDEARQHLDADPEADASGPREDPP